jgi:outer membrane autotransporter protein
LNVERPKAGDVGVTGTRQRRRLGGLRHARRARTLRRAALLAGVSCAALAVLAPGAVYAQVDGTWQGPGNEWTDGTNWSSNPDVPDNTATFTNNGAPTSVTISNDAEISTMQFTAAAPAYSFTISSAFTIAGIDNSSAFAPSFILNSGGVLSFEIDNGSNLAFSGAISGSGGIVKDGEGTLTLSGNNSYTGGTLVNEGTLAVGSNTALGTGTLFLAEETTLQAAANWLKLTNAIQLLGDATVDTQSNTLALSGSISGTGGLDKIGSGTLIMTGVSTYTGDTNVNEGVLRVDGSLVSVVSVNAGGTLMGTGTIGGLEIGSGGIVAPGSSSWIGTLRVAGDVSFDEGSIYRVKANAAGQADKIIATGAASIDGGTVQVLAQSGNYARQTRYTILTASGGVDGEFDNVTSNLAFLTPFLTYDPNNVFLTLVRNDITFASVAQTPNQRAVAAALDQSAPLKPLVQAVANLTVAGARQAFDALSGEVHGSAQTTMIDDSRYMRQAVLGRLRQVPYAGADGAMAALGSGGPILAYADPGAAGSLADRDGQRAINQMFGAPAQSSDLTFWAQGVGAWGRVNSDGNAADLNRNLGGVFTGFDARFGEWRAGLAGGYTNASANVSARASSANIDSAYFAGYGGASFGALNFRSGAALAWHTIGTSRSIIFPGFSEQASARYSAVSGQVFGEVGYGMSFGNMAVEPFAGLAWVFLNTESFNETGGVAALNASSTQSDVNYSTLGARWASNYLMPNGMIFMPRASLAWQHAFGTVTPGAALTFQNTGVPFGILGAPIARDAALVEAGGDLQLGPQTKFGVAYFGQLASNARDHSVKANFSWRF